MKNLKDAIRAKEEQIRVLMEQLDKLRAAAVILEEEDSPRGSVVAAEHAPAPPAKTESGTVPVQKRAWP